MMSAPADDVHFLRPYLCLRRCRVQRRRPLTHLHPTTTVLSPTPAHAHAPMAAPLEHRRQHVARFLVVRRRQYVARRPRMTEYRGEHVPLSCRRTRPGLGLVLAEEDVQRRKTLGTWKLWSARGSRAIDQPCRQGGRGMSGTYGLPRIEGRCQFLRAWISSQHDGGQHKVPRSKPSFSQHGDIEWEGKPAPTPRG